MKRNSSFFPLIRFEGCERPEHDTDSCSLWAKDKTGRPICSQVIQYYCLTDLHRDGKTVVIREQQIVRFY